MQPIVQPMMNPYWLIAAGAAFALLPAALSLTTAYVKVSVVLSMVRNALGTQQVPGSIVIMSLSCALTAFVMGPVFQQSIDQAKTLPLDKILSGKLTFPAAAESRRLFDPWRGFLLKHVQPRELEALARLDIDPSAPADLTVQVMKDPPLRILIPAFMLGELRQAFTMGFLVLLPFLVIDLIVANVLAGMGMMMMSPVLVSLPLKLLLFVVSDGWLLVVRGLILSYR